MTVTQAQQPTQPQLAVSAQALSIKDHTLSQTIPVILPEYTPIVLESNSDQHRVSFLYQDKKGIKIIFF